MKTFLHMERIRRWSAARRLSARVRTEKGASMFCTNCGYELKEGDRFCENCGTPVENPPVENPPVENPAKTIKEEPVPIQPENTALPPERTEEQTGVT